MTNIRPGSKNYFHLGGKIDPIAEIVNAGILTTGKVYWVKDIDDEDYLEFKDRVGEHYCDTDIQSAIDKCVDDQNDYVMVCPKNAGSAWHVIPAIGGINLNKDKVHLIGVGYNANNQYYGCRIEGFGTAGVGTALGGTITDNGLLYVTGNGCEVAGFRLAATAGTGGGGTAETAACLGISGHDAWVHDCAVEISGGAWDEGTPSAAIVGGSAISGARLENLDVSYGTDTTAGAINGVTLGAQARDWLIKDSRFFTWAEDAEDAAIVSGTGSIRGIHVLVDNCMAINANTGTAVAEMVQGTCPALSMSHIKNCAAVGFTAMSDDAQITITPTLNGTVGLLENPGLAISGTALLATGD